MNYIDKHIRNCIFKYTSQNSSRIKVLSHTFSTIGGGYDWVDGELKYLSEGGWISLREEEELTECDRTYALECVKINPKWMHYLRLLHEMDFIDKNIDLIMKDKPHSYQSSFWSANSHYLVNIHNTGVKNIFFSAPVGEVKPEWYEVMEEFGRVWKHFFFVLNRSHGRKEVQFNHETGDIVLCGSVPDAVKIDVEKYNAINQHLNKIKEAL